MSYGKSERAREEDAALPGFRIELGNRLREVERKFKNRSEAAKAAGVAKSTLQSWIEGKSDPSFEGMVRLAAAAEIAMEWLATGEGPQLRSDLPSAPAAHGWDPELMRICMIAADELLEELGRTMEPAEKADAVLKMYRSELDRKVTGQPSLSPAEVVRLFKKVA